MLIGFMDEEDAEVIPRSPLTEGLCIHPDLCKRGARHIGLGRIEHLKYFNFLSLIANSRDKVRYSKWLEMNLERRAYGNS